MSRLYDRLLAFGAQPVNPASTVAEQRAFRETVRDVPVVDASNVCSYYFEGTGQEYWDIHRDFPNLAPPFHSFWVECRAPRQVVSDEFGTQPWSASDPRAWGVFIESRDFCRDRPEASEALQALKDSKAGLERTYGSTLRSIASGFAPDDFAKAVEGLAPDVKRGVLSLASIYRMEEMAANDAESFMKGIWSDDLPYEWGLRCTLVLEFGKGDIRGPVIFWTLLLTPDGLPVDGETGQIGSFLPDTSGAEANEELSKFLHPALLAVSFMHCKNVAFDQYKPPEKISRKHERRHGLPLTKYYTLEIDPIRKLLRDEGGAEKTGLKHALHICRGHFKTYTDEKPLFGKRTGTYWWPQTVRGSKARGEVVKDYSLKGST